MNQHATSRPTANTIVRIVLRSGGEKYQIVRQRDLSGLLQLETMTRSQTHSQSLRDHHSVSRNATASTNEHTLLATMLKPQVIKHAPMKAEPRYPALSVIAGLPPDMCVTPPSFGSRLIDLILAPVSTPVKALMGQTSVAERPRRRTRLSSFGFSPLTVQTRETRPSAS